MPEADSQLNMSEWLPALGLVYEEARVMQVTDVGKLFW